MHVDLVASLFFIFFGAALLSTVTLLARQSLLVAYMVLGIVLGPYGIALINDVGFVQNVGDVGIIFLLFLLGLHLPPQKLYLMLRKISLVGCVSSIIFFVIGFMVALFFNYSLGSCFLLGAAMVFSSTIIGIKLLPTTVLHHQHTGEVMISVLLFQDILAIIVLLLMRALTMGGSIVHDVSMVILGFPAVLLIAFLVERYVLMPLFSKFSRIKEYMFLVSIAWCLAISELATFVGLSHEIGAFIAGVTLASSPISVYIAESLKPVRDFFLVMFFFSVGAMFDLSYLPKIIIPAVILAAAFFVIKPLVYQRLLVFVGEAKELSLEIGFRLGQISEFSLIIAATGLQTGLIPSKTAYLIQAVTILSFMASSSAVVLRYPTPVSLSEKLRRD